MTSKLYYAHQNLDDVVPGQSPETERLVDIMRAFIPVLQADLSLVEPRTNDAVLNRIVSLAMTLSVTLVINTYKPDGHAVALAKLQERLNDGLTQARM